MSTSAGPNIIEDGLVLSIDTANQKSYSPNMFQYSTNINSWTTVANNATLSTDSIKSPVGNSPMKMVTTGNDAHTSTYNTSVWNISPVKNLETWTVSVYVKANIPTSVQLFIFGANSSGVSYVAPSYIGLTAKTFNIGIEWTRIEHKITFNNVNVAYIQFRLDGPDTFNNSIIWWDGVQVERSSSATPFNPNHNPQKVKNLVNQSQEGIITTVQENSADNIRSLIFDGTNDYITVGSSITDSQLNSSSWTIGTWVNFSYLPPASPWGYILSHGSTSTNNGLHFRSSQNKIRFGLYGNDIDSSTSLSIDTWYNLVFSFDYSTKIKKIYINGEMDASGGNVGYSGTGSNVFIGRSWSNVNNFFDGKIGSIYFYDFLLSDEAIKQNFNALRGRYGI